MTDRIIEIAETAAFLSLDNRRLKIDLPERDELFIPLAEIQCLILANPAVTVTGALLSGLAEAGATVVVSGKNRMPEAMLLPLEGNYIQNERFRAQSAAPLPLLKRLWQCIVKAKIRSQAETLEALHGEDFNLLRLSREVNSGDTENLEGRAAAIYWKNLFARPFLRDREAADNNLLLNYGYAILRAMTARACCGAGLHPTLGIDHHNRYNSFCLADDLMEPFRVVVDRAVFALNPENREIGSLTGEARATLLKALLAPQKTSEGNRSLADLLKRSAIETANSFQSGEMKLKYL